MKNIIRSFIFKNTRLKNVYETISYYKWKFIYGIRLSIPILFYRLIHKNSVFLIFTPEHANLGDHAIAFAEKRIFNKLDIKYHEITGKQLYDLYYYGFLGILNNFYNNLKVGLTWLDSSTIFHSFLFLEQ